MKPIFVLFLNKNRFQIYFSFCCDSKIGDKHDLSAWPSWEKIPPHPKKKEMCVCLCACVYLSFWQPHDTPICAATSALRMQSVSDRATRYGLDGPNPRWAQKTLSSRIPSRPDLGTTRLPVQHKRCSFLGINWPERDDDHPPPSSADVKNQRS